MSPADATYARLVAEVSAAIRGRIGDLNARLPETGRSLGFLLADVLGAVVPSLEIECTACGRRRHVVWSRRKGTIVMQRVRCGCGVLERRVPGCVVPRRQRRA